MVRVFSVYQFGGQVIHRVPDDIRAACLIDSTHVALAKYNHLVEIVSLRHSIRFDVDSCEFDINLSEDNNVKVEYAFPTIDEVVEMVYCKFGDYIATVEQKAANQTFCRIYTNFPKTKATDERNDVTDNNDPMSCNVTIRARIAGRVTPSANTNCLEVIEIPLTPFSNIISANQRLNPHKVAVCQQTGTFIVGLDRIIKLFRFIECTNDSTHFKYIDFTELPLEIELEFMPIYLDINEHIIGVGNKEYMCIFKLLERNYCNTADSDAISANSLTTSSELSGIAGVNYATQNPLSDGKAANNENYKSSKDTEPLDYKNASEKLLSSITSNISSTFDRPRKNSLRGRSERKCYSVELRPVPIDNSMPLCNLRHLSASNDTAFKDYVIRPLFQMRQYDAANDPFQCLLLKPIYVRNDSNMSSAETVYRGYDSLSNIFKSVNGLRFIGISVFLATVNEGYLYQFSNNEKWTINEEDVQSNSLIATYSFTSPLVTVCVTDYVIHALTDHGIETYTHRIGHKLFMSSYEYGLRDDPCTIEASPRVDEQICLIGLRPFLGIQRMFATQQNLILLAQSPGVELSAIPNGTKKSKRQSTIVEPPSNWTIYNLKVAQADVLYKDFLELAADHATDFTKPMKKSDSDKIKIYSLLLSEAHTILRIANEISFENIKSDADRRLESLYLNSCQQLADFYIMSTNRDQYCLAYPYYSMARTTIDQVYKRIISMTQNVELGADAMKGSVHTLKRMITKSTETNENTERRLATTCNGTTFGDKLLEFFIKYAPNEIATLALSSTTFHEIMNTKIANAIVQLKSDEQLSNEEKLCLILHAISSHDQKRVTQLLQSFSSVELYRLLVAYWSVLFDTTKIKRTGKILTTFSELTESYLLPAICQTECVRIALLATLKHLLVDTNVLNIEIILKLFMDYLASHFGQMSAYTSVQAIMENILEAYFYRMCVVRGYSEPISTTSQAITRNSQKNDQIRSNNISGNNNNNDSLCSQASTSSEKSTLSMSITNSDNSSYATGLSKSMKQPNGSHSQQSRVGEARVSPITASTLNGITDDTAQKNQTFTSSFYNEAMKILIRIYLSSLKTFPLDAKEKSINKSIQLKYVRFIRENVSRVYGNHMTRSHCDLLDASNPPPFEHTVRVNNVDGDDASAAEVIISKTPILFFERRLSYLNILPPINESEHFEKLVSSSDGNIDLQCENDERRKAILIVIKLQALLSSGKLTRDIIQEIIHFIQANMPFIGHTSLMTCLLPFDICVDYLIEIQPEYLFEYAKNHIMDDHKWQFILLRITSQCKRVVEDRSLEFYETMLKDHLDYLVHFKSLAEVLTILPHKYIGDLSVQAHSSAAHTHNDGSEMIENHDNVSMTNQLSSNGDVSSCNGYNGFTEHSDNEQPKMESINNNDVAIFTHYLKMSIDLDRSERLSEMIRTTGYQLYNTYIGVNGYIDAAANDNDE